MAPLQVYDCVVYMSDIKVLLPKAWNESFLRSWDHTFGVASSSLSNRFYYISCCLRLTIVACVWHWIGWFGGTSSHRIEKTWRATRDSSQSPSCWCGCPPDSPAPPTQAAALPSIRPRRRSARNSTCCRLRHNRTGATVAAWRWATEVIHPNTSIIIERGKGWAK